MYNVKFCLIPSPAGISCWFAGTIPTLVSSLALQIILIWGSSHFLSWIVWSWSILVKRSCPSIVLLSKNDVLFSQYLQKGRQGKYLCAVIQLIEVETIQNLSHIQSIGIDPKVQVYQTLLLHAKRSTKTTAIFIK